MEADRDYSSPSSYLPNLLLHANPDRTATDGYSIVHSPPFTFLVGPNHTKLTIQAGLARHVSQPLDHLMNSGETRESKHHIAVLEDEDVETFVAFCEYAYTGDYRVPPPGSREEDRDDQRVSNPFRGVFSKGSPTSPVRTIPPRAPTPPRTSSRETHDRPGEGVYAGSGKDDDDWECAIAPDEEPANPGQEFRSESRRPSDQPPMTPAVDRKEEEDAWDAADDEAAKGKKSKKHKKNNKKKRGGASEETTPKLTPPSTPPPENLKPEEEGNPSAEANAVTEQWEQDHAPVEESGPAESAPYTETWEQTAATPPAEAEPSDADKLGAKDRLQAPKEEKQPGHDHSGRRLTGPMIDTSFAKQQYSRLHEKGSNLWDEFAAIDYIDPRSCLSTRPPSAMSSRSPHELPYLVFHAKLYVFATRYLIPALAQLCLRKLHRDLLYLGFPERDQVDDDDDHHALASIKARKVLDLLHYTYTKTTRLEPITPTSATQLRDNELRKLVVHFAACKVRDLASYCPPVESDLGSPSTRSQKPSAQGLRALLDSTTELASDLVYRMMM
ncbi:uncharacterized protein BO95DRAFT_430812 [Aspergillus brunneoviolaceus CBS 621.78]|uniref:Uncharacterized protein n=1 Tax=Aspergillus brunneoviolaceus CBS 621.78 TaxID=1450534 RepID=A0ACD1GCL9_9EURO|nr:hypothetical protein BO95DRAFT_430812 [Aspergillus brunneoviolaceus CBS 621.78]RAH47003.1 hypothetical protein BO95DRAFT_430812 [Aspergillus brunneoviolaceus CBS 621.78]